MFENLAPHAMCLSANPLLIWLLVIFNLMIMLTYLAIPIAMYCYFRIGGLPIIVKLFMIFVLACSLTHLMTVVTMYTGGFAYWIEVFVCGVAVIASSVTAMLVWTQGLQIKQWVRTTFIETIVK